MLLTKYNSKCLYPGSQPVGISDHQRLSVPRRLLVYEAIDLNTSKYRAASTPGPWLHLQLKVLTIAPVASHSQLPEVIGGLMIAPHEECRVWCSHVPRVVLPEGVHCSKFDGACQCFQIGFISDSLQYPSQITVSTIHIEAPGNKSLGKQIGNTEAERKDA